MDAARVAIIVFALALTSGRVYRPSGRYPLLHPVVPVSPKILWGIARAESAFDPLAVSPDGRDRGMFQLRRDFDSERGVDNPYNPVEAVHHAIRILEADMDALGSTDLALTAYRRGRAGARRHGVDREYVARVKGER